MKSIALHPRRRIGEEDLWRSFASAFPRRPEGRDERDWLLAALKEAEARGLVCLPNAKSRRWKKRLGVALPVSVDRPKPPRVKSDDGWRRFPWHPRLQWVLDLAHLRPEYEKLLRRIHEGLVNGEFEAEALIHYRSLQLTGDEKMLGRLLETRLFEPERLSLELLGCIHDVPPLARERVGDAPRLLVLENAGAFSVAYRVLRRMTRPPYGAVALGDGTRFQVSIRHLLLVAERYDEIHYLGDIDREGLDIALHVQMVAKTSRALPPVVPAPRLHEAMLRAARRLGRPLGWLHERKKSAPFEAEALAAFVPAEVRSEVAAILDAGHRIPEEVLGFEELASEWRDALE